MKTIALLLSLVFLSGCAGTGWYGEIGAGWKNDSTTSYVLREGCHRVLSTDPRARRDASCGGDNPTAHLSVGYEWRKPYRCELHHFSHFFDGGVDRETHLDEIRCMRRFGGR